MHPCGRNNRASFRHNAQNLSLRERVRFVRHEIIYLLAVFRSYLFVFRFGVLAVVFGLARKLERGYVRNNRQFAAAGRPLHLDSWIHGVCSFSGHW